MNRYHENTSKKVRKFEEKKSLIKIKRILLLVEKAGFDAFLLGIILMVLLAYFWPEPGLQEGIFSVKGVANYGIALIFFFYGLRLSPLKLKSGISNWRLHVLIQFATFLIFPLIVLALKPLFQDGENYVLWLGVFFLAALPSTVSSSVVMVSIAGGNLPSAIFNASISSLIGVFITPLWMGLVLAASEVAYDFLNIIGKLTLQVLVPLVAGLLLMPYLGKFAEAHKKKLKYFDQTIILMIVYTSFSESFAQNMFQIIDLVDLLVLSALMIGFFFIMYGILYFLTYILKFNREDRVTALFCGSKKSLVQGTVMAKVLFPGSSILGIILLPIMIYHAFQLVAASVIAQSMARSINLDTIKKEKAFNNSQ